MSKISWTLVIITFCPKQIEVNEIINKIDNGTRFINFTEFCQILVEKNTEADLENEYKVFNFYISLLQYKKNEPHDE